MGKPLVIVESPAKARTIGRFLGEDYRVEASVGHVRDLPESAAAIPAAKRKLPWARLGVDTDNDFQPIYVYTGRGKDQIKKLKPLVEAAEALFLATDEDREGEAIAWHLHQVLNPKIPVYRLVFHEITRGAIEQALASPRQIDEDLVQAQETRRVVDRLYGYAVSPVLWRKIRPRLSAGRVQSVAVRLVVERERARMRFVPATWWDLVASFQATKGSYEGRLVEVDGKRVAAGRDFDPETGALSADARREAPLVLDEAAARALHARLAEGRAYVDAVSTKPFTERPAAPFITSTLQQEANRKLRWAARRTMNAAQRLYEEGWITYMRTDSTQLAASAVDTLRAEIARRFGPDALPAQPRRYESKSRAAQEAHEAIRPAGDVLRPPEVCRRQVGGDEASLYELIWNRALACQMNDARGTRMIVTTAVDGGQGGKVLFRSTGRAYLDPGFRAAYVEDKDDRGVDNDAERRAALPPLTANEVVQANDISADRHDTTAPPRLTDATLVKELETRGIGRPSTYATIIETIEQRGYVRKRGTTLVPTWTAFAVTALLEQHFGSLVDYDFTARLEDGLDEIAVGRADRGRFLEAFYRGGDERPGLTALVDAAQEEADPRLVCRVALGMDGDHEIAVRIGRFGPYLERDGQRGNLPEEIAPDEIDVARARALLQEAGRWPRALGADPATGQPVAVHVGRFGPHVQLGEGDKPKRASLLKGMDPETICLETALALLSLPRAIGEDATGNTVVAANGRFGPYVKAGDETRSLPAEISPLEVTLAQALEVLTAPRRAARAVESLRELGAGPEGRTVVVKQGRYGPFVTDGQVNASLPKGARPETFELAEALRLLEAKAAQPDTGRGRRGGVKTGDSRAAKATPRKPAASGKKPAAKKPATGARKAGGGARKAEK